MYYEVEKRINEWLDKENVWMVSPQETYFDYYNLKRSSSIH